MEAELRRRLRLDLSHARSVAEDGQVDDATLAEIIAKAIASALGWHTESPQHVRNATTSSRSWRPAGGPRGGPPPRDYDEAPPRRPPPRAREYEEQYEEDFRPRPRPRGGPPQFQQRGPRPGGRRPPMGRGGGGGFAPRKPRRGG
jgi:hypothetical protein